MSTTQTIPDPDSTPRAIATSQIITLPPIPELFDPNFLDVLIPLDQRALARSIPEKASDASINASQPSDHHKLTANNAPTFSSTLDSTLDAYLNIRCCDAEEDITHYLVNAWAEDPDLTLRIIWSARSIHDGMANKEVFYRAFAWLFEKHPRTAITNLHILVDPVCLRSGKGKQTKEGLSHGYWKDLLNILALATVGELTPGSPEQPRHNFLHNYPNHEARPLFRSNKEQEEWSRAQRIEQSHRAYSRLSQKLLDKHYRALYVAVARLFSIQLAKDVDVMAKIDALPAGSNNKGRTELLRTLTLVSKWAPTPGGSHDRVTNIASAICLLLLEASVISPTAHDISFPSTTTLPASEIHRLRCIYQQHVLTRGRRYICIPEPFMSSNRWSEIVYSRVASVCMNKKRGWFLVRDEDRYLKYLDDVESGKKNISGATLLPHLLALEAIAFHRQLSAGANSNQTRSLASALGEQQRSFVEAQTRVVDAQWATLVGRLRESGQLDNCVAVCDVSESMGSTHYVASKRRSAFDVEPIWPALSLSLLVARLAKPPFNDSFITFSKLPEFVTLDPESRRVSLGETIDGMCQASWGMNTDFNAVFLELILPLAVKHNVPKDQMIKRIFVFSDMQFDEANVNAKDDVVTATGAPTNVDTTCDDWDRTTGQENKDVSAVAPAGVSETKTNEEVASAAAVASKWKTNHDVIAEAYARAGYDVPELVYWDLSNPKGGHGITAPVTGDREGVAMVSGYSPALLKTFMDVEEEEGGEKWKVLGKDGQSRPERYSPTLEENMKKALSRESYSRLVVVD